MEIIHTSDKSLSVIITNLSDELSEYNMMINAIELLINNFDPSVYEETMSNYSIFYERILKLIARHIIKYAADGPDPTMSLYDIIMDQIEVSRMFNGDEMP